MDVPAGSPGYGQQQPWTCYSGWPGVLPAAGCPTGVPSSPPYECPNQGLLNGPSAMGHIPPPPVGRTGSSARLPLSPNSGFQQPRHWQQSQQHSNGMLCEPVPDLTEETQSSPGDSYTQPNNLASSPSSESRYGLDPQLLPSAVEVMKEDRVEWEGKVFVSESDSPLPPLSTTACTLEDRGNASPRFIRCTTYCFPSDAQASLQSHLPLGAILTPLAQLERGERAVPVCEEEECMKGCGECGAFMCPAMTWQDCGQRFYCPFCGKHSEVPWQFYQPTNSHGQRVDSQQRPELRLGSYDILETRKDKAAVFLLAIDVSAHAVRAGQLDFICQQIHSLLQSLIREEGAVQSDLRVGLMTYDSRIHLYDLCPTLSRPHMLVITETDNLELPVKEGFLVPLKDCKHIIGSVLQQIPLFSAEPQDTPGSQELPVSAGLKILQAAGCPGRLLVLHSSPLSQGSLQYSSPGLFSSSKPKSLFQPPDSSVSLAKDCVSQGCSVHLFVFSQQDVGGAWPGDLPYLTGGGLLCYSGLQAAVERERFSGDLRRSVETEAGYRAQLRVFVSKELRVSGCYGSFTSGPEPSRIAMAALDWRTALALEFTHCRALDETRGVVIQVALSYTTPTGDRRTRVHSLTLRCSRHLLDTFRHSQAETLLTFYCKKTYCAVLEHPLQSLREELQTEVTEALACYRKHCCSTSVSPGQLVLPQFLKVLPVYMNSLRKSEVLLPGLRSSVHQRLQLRSQIVAMDTRNTATHFYPLLLPLPVCAGAVSVPSAGEALRCTSSSLALGGLYLAHCPLALVLWVGRCAPSQALEQLFSAACFASLPSGEINLPVLENPLSASVRTLINTLQSSAPFTLKLKVVKQGDSCEEALQRLLVEDKSPNGGASYADFLYHLHVNSLRLLV